MAITDVALLAAKIHEKKDIQREGTGGKGAQENIYMIKEMTGTGSMI